MRYYAGDFRRFFIVVVKINGCGFHGFTNNLKVAARWSNKLLIWCSCHPKHTASLLADLATKELVFGFGPFLVCALNVHVNTIDFAVFAAHHTYQTCALCVAKISTKIRIRLLSLHETQPLIALGYVWEGREKDREYRWLLVGFNYVSERASLWSADALIPRSKGLHHLYRHLLIRDMWGGLADSQRRRLRWYPS